MRDRPPLVFAVGDEVVLTGVNRRVPTHTKVLRVGPKRVYVACDNGTYRRSDGVRDDAYQHDNIRPVAVYEYDARVRTAADVLAANGFLLDYRKRPGDKIVLAMADYLLTLIGPKENA